MSAARSVFCKRCAIGRKFLVGSALVFTFLFSRGALSSAAQPAVFFLSQNLSSTESFP
jgi:hypothetical protein